MNDSVRHERILELLRESPFASARNLSERLSVSVATVRRDIDKLDEQGRARKVYGGISAIDGAIAHGVFARTYVESSDIAIAAKEAIAAEAATMVQEGDAVIVHGGSTCFRLGERIARRTIRLCTNSMPLAAMLGESGTCALTVAGGELHREPRILHGAPAAPFYASKFFLSAQGVSERGLLESHPLLVDAAGRFAESADRIVALIDSSKFAVGARQLSLPWSRIDTLITDDGLADEHREMVEGKGVDIRIVRTRAGEA
ncbi:DeoR/GlpR family DNA-binding transcription regulator [Sphingomonas sp. ACRSK]|uniref:DeoR/GlpR family DNA-binding transcription regulator n=1 Tax=Sphingomonas sp. ACRSK TaxID=2918213 RepID=UPI001EF6C6CB|nr:DeoR/GlpR family DNA-binding transcription regulator [Sphingomonas sp. ACRSK]